MKDMEQVEQKGNMRNNPVGAFFQRNYPLFFAPVIVAFAYVIALLQYDVYPFGNKYTAASYDLSAQIAPFVEHLFDVFDGKSTLTFSYAIVGGADVTGTFLYFFISPFSFLFLLFGDGKVAHASSIVMLCKLASISVAGTWFAQKLFKGIPDYLCIAVGVTYAYCGYTFVANTYINWLDFLIYLPFCVGGFCKFTKTGSFLLFALLTSCCIYTCFSIACFALFTVYPALIFYALLCVKKEERGEFISKFSLALLTAILLALPVLLPALGAYSVSGRGGSLFENLWKGFTLSSEGNPEIFQSSVFIDSYVESMYRKWSYIFSDAVFLVLTLIWFYRKGLRDKFAQFMLLAGVLTSLPLLVDESMNLLNMGSYMSYALRFGFLNAVYFLGGACLCLENICYKPFSAYDGNLLFSQSDEGGRYAFKSIFRKENRRILLWSSGLIVLGLAVAGFLLWFISGDNYLTLLAAFGSDSSGFSGSYAHSLGGLEVVIIPFILVAIVLIVGAFFVADKKTTPRLLSIVLVVVVGLQVFFYNGHLVLGNRSTQHERLGSYQVLNEEFSCREEGYFRVKDYDDSMTACAPFTGGGNSFSVFSSVIDKDNFQLFSLFGYKGNGKNTFKSAHNEGASNLDKVFADCFMGYKYFVSTQEDLHTQDGLKKYVQPVYTAAGERLQEGDLYAYENTIVFPSGYKVASGEFRFVAPNTNSSTNRKKNQAALYEFLAGERLTTEKVTPDIARRLCEDLKNRQAQVQVGAGKITARVTASAGEGLLLNFVAVKGYTVTVNGKKAKLIENDLKLLSVGLEKGENEVVFTYRSPYRKQAVIGALVGLIGLLAVAFVYRKTKLVERCAPVIAGIGIALALGLIVFFMVFPTGVFLTKVLELLKGWLL